MVGRIMYILRSWRQFFRHSQPIIHVEISKSALLHNLRILESFAPPWGIAPVLKSNAYGHGVILVAGVLKSEKNIPFFAVDSYFEARVIRDAGITKKILILGHTPLDTMKKNKNNGISFAVSSLEQLKAFVQEKADQNVHVKFDTGMHRQGISHTEIEAAIRLMQQMPHGQVEGVFSHFADADTTDSVLTKEQIARWNELAKRLQKEIPAIRYYHMANSSGFRYAGDIVANVGRSGNMLYGTNSGRLPAAFRPALKMTSIISEIRTIETGEAVGYNGTFLAEHPMTIATVPAGYYEGITRRLSNKGSYIIEDRVAPIVGRVSMNISSCDVTDIPRAKIGSVVTLISDKAEDQNSVVNIAKMCDTIPYEILVHIPVHLHRMLVE